MKALVTGGAGFIGSHLCELLLEKGYRVTAFDNMTRGKPYNLREVLNHPRLRLLEGDIRQWNSIYNAMMGQDLVFHLAARPGVQASIDYPLETYRDNVEGTMLVLECARQLKVNQLVFASSSSIYGDNPVLPRGESVIPAPMSPYAASKVAGENYCMAYSRCFGIKTAIVRYFNVYGPRQNPAYATVIPNFTNALRQKELAIVYGDGEQTRDFTYVADAVTATVLVAETTGTFNVSGGTAYSINNLLKIMADVMGCEPLSKHAPPLQGDIKDSLADLTAIRALGYEPRFNLRQGLESTIASYARVS